MFEQNVINLKCSGSKCVTANSERTNSKLSDSAENNTAVAATESN